DGIRDATVTGVQTCALPISGGAAPAGRVGAGRAHPSWMARDERLLRAVVAAESRVLNNLPSPKISPSPLREGSWTGSRRTMPSACVQVSLPLAGRVGDRVSSHSAFRLRSGLPPPFREPLLSGSRDFPRGQGRGGGLG